MRDMISKILELLRNRNAGIIGAVGGFILAILFVKYGFFRTLFILLLTLIGYFVGNKFFRDRDRIKDFLDKLLPPGRFR